MRIAPVSKVIRTKKCQDSVDKDGREGCRLFRNRFADKFNRRGKRSASRNLWEDSVLKGSVIDALI